jgi:hypothetical protein
MQNKLLSALVQKPTKGWNEDLGNPTLNRMPRGMEERSMKPGQWPKRRREFICIGLHRQTSHTSPAFSKGGLGSHVNCSGKDLKDFNVTSYTDIPTVGRNRTSMEY